jgi:putative addiction module CopG family antidote
MSIDVSPEVAQLIAQEISLGRYSNEQELLSEAVRLLSQRNRLREEIAAGTRQLAAGEYTDYDSKSLRQRFDKLKDGKSFGG